MYYRQVLEAQDFAVEEAGNGYEGLEKALVGSFDLYIVDVNMPKMDGYTLSRTIRQEPSICATPAIMISTEGQTQDANAAYASGANPVSYTHLDVYKRQSLEGGSGSAHAGQFHRPFCQADGWPVQPAGA